MRTEVRSKDTGSSVFEKNDTYNALDAHFE